MTDENKDESVIPMFKVICFTIVFFFLFYILSVILFISSIILFIGLFPVISDFINSFIKNINGYQVCLISIFASIITVLYYVIRNIRKFVNK